MKGASVPAAVWIIVIAAIAGVTGLVMYAVTTFLFAFSGGQYRMVPVVGFGALAVIVAALLAAAVTWRLGSAARATVVAALVTAAGWVAAVFIEWRISFVLGAGS